MAYLTTKCLVFTGSVGHAIDIAKLQDKRELNACIGIKRDKSFLRIRIRVEGTKIHLHLFADGTYLLTGPKTEPDAVKIMNHVAPMLA